jgi:hypothetical protein
VTGLPLEVARRCWTRRWLPCRRRPIASRRYPPGIVELQRPAPGGTTRPATATRWSCGSPPRSRPRSQVPDVRDMTRRTLSTCSEAGWVGTDRPARCARTGGLQRPVDPHLGPVPRRRGTLERDHSIITLYRGHPSRRPGCHRVTDPRAATEPTSEPTPEPPRPRTPSSVVRHRLTSSGGAGVAPVGGHAASVIQKRQGWSAAWRTPTRGPVRRPTRRSIRTSSVASRSGLRRVAQVRAVPGPVHAQAPAVRRAGPASQVGVLPRGGASRRTRSWPSSTSAASEQDRTRLVRQAGNHVARSGASRR